MGSTTITSAIFTDFNAAAISTRRSRVASSASDSRAISANRLFTAITPLSLSRTKIPSIADVPEIFNVDTIDNNANTVNVASSKAVGEPPLLLGISVFMAVKNALSFVSNGAIPKIDAPATGEEILKRLTEYRTAERANHRTAAVV